MIMGAKKTETPRLTPKRGLVRYPDFEQLTFPSYVTASLEYFATGEGVTRGISMLCVTSAEELRASLIKLWSEYFAVSCEAANGLVVIPGFGDVIPERVQRIIEGTNRQGRMPHNFLFNLMAHENYA